MQQNDGLADGAGENHDVDDLDLNGAQLPLLWEVCKAAKEAGAAVVVVVVSAQPKTFGAAMWTPIGVGAPNALVGEFGALLAAWRPGEEGGTAVVEIITGKANPSGRLSHTWPAKAGQVHSVVSNSYHMPASAAGGSFAFTTGPLAPLFPFGFGLSYSEFTIGKPSITLPSAGAPVGAAQRFALAIPVMNSPDRPAGRVTLGVYAEPTFQLIGQAQPVNRLLCWNQAVVPSGGTATVSISCAASDLGMWDLAVGDYLVKAGAYQLTIAQYSGDPAADRNLTVDVRATPIPAPGDSMRDRAEAISGVKI